MATKDSGEGSSNSVRLKGFGLRSPAAEPCEPANQVRTDEPGISAGGEPAAAGGVRLKFAAPEDSAPPAQAPAEVPPQSPPPASVTTKAEANEPVNRRAENYEPDIKYKQSAGQIRAAFQNGRTDSPMNSQLPPAAPAGKAARGSYTADPDPERVRRRQWWKYDLYTRSGRKGIDEQGQRRGGGDARSQ
jgi:hypothetical protein